jgi:hypothetical protein
MRKILTDILRDKGSVKFSITKIISLITFIFFVGYLGYYLLWIHEPIDHTLVIELIGFMLTLLGFKNGWGVKKMDSAGSVSSEIKFESKADSTLENEGTF